MITDILTRKEDTMELRNPLRPRKIFLQTMNLDKAKKKRYHSSMKMSELEKDSEEI